MSLVGGEREAVKGLEEGSKRDGSQRKSPGRSERRERCIVMPSTRTSLGTEPCKEQG